MKNVLNNVCPLRNVAAYTDSPVMAEAWHAALLFAAGERDIIARFESETGLNWPYKFISPGSPEKLSVDERDHALIAFVHWFNSNIWGESPFEKGH